MGLLGSLKGHIGKAHQEAKAPSKVIYGVTDRRNENFLVRLNDWLIDHTPVRGKEKGLFFYSLQLLVNSGVEFTRALEILADRARNPHMQRIINTMVYDMKFGGLSFSRTMAKFPKVFSESETKMVYSGEITGKIEETLSNIAAQIQKNIDLEGRIKSSMMYPATVLVAIIIAGVVVVAYIVPQFMVLFEQFDTDLPTATKVLIGASGFFRKLWWLLLVLLVGGVLLFKNWKTTRAGRLKWNRFTLRLPLVKKLVNNIQTVRLSSNLSTLLQSGVSADQALQILGEIMPNKVIGESVFGVKQKVLKGSSMSQSFRENALFDPIIGEVVEIGERTGNIPNVLKRTAQQYQQEVDAQLKNLTTIIEPVIILLVGGAVVFMAMAILSPIFQLQQLFTTV